MSKSDFDDYSSEHLIIQLSSTSNLTFRTVELGYIGRLCIGILDISATSRRFLGFLVYVSESSLYRSSE